MEPQWIAVSEKLQLLSAFVQHCFTSVASWQVSMHKRKEKTGQKSIVTGAAKNLN